MKVFQDTTGLGMSGEILRKDDFFFFFNPFGCQHKLSYTLQPSRNSPHWGSSSA